MLWKILRAKNETIFLQNSAQKWNSVADFAAFAARFGPAPTQDVVFVSRVRTWKPAMETFGLGIFIAKGDAHWSA